MAGNTSNSDWQQAVYSALSEHLSAADARTATEIWQSKYAGGRSSTVVSFMRDLSIQFGLDSRQRHELRTAIYRAMVYGPQATAPESFPAAQAREVADALIRGILQGAQAASSSAPQDILAELADGLRWHATLQSQANVILRWVGHGSATPNLQESDLAAATHLVYVACCRALGPVTGDKILHKAAARADALPAASRFPVSRLLYPDKP